MDGFIGGSALRSWGIVRAGHWRWAFEELPAFSSPPLSFLPSSFPCFSFPSFDPSPLSPLLPPTYSFLSPLLPFSRWPWGMHPPSPYISSARMLSLISGPKQQSQPSVDSNLQNHMSQQVLCRKTFSRILSYHQNRTNIGLIKGTFAYNIWIKWQIKITNC